MSSELLPPGFRFHPTDEELIVHYLRNQATSRTSPVPGIIPEVNIYKFDPWELPDKSDMHDGEWYFFSPRDRKYPNGTRPNRATKSGYWKATGVDKAIHSGSTVVGIKKALVFYNGKPPRGSKTQWMMHEYRLSPATDKRSGSGSGYGSMRLDDWVLCRIYQKKSTSSNKDQHCDIDDRSPVLPLPRTCSLAHLLESYEFMSASQLLDETPFCSIDDLFAADALMS